MLGIYCAIQTTSAQFVNPMLGVVFQNPISLNTGPTCGTISSNDLFCSPDAHARVHDVIHALWTSENGRV